VTTYRVCTFYCVPEHGLCRGGCIE